MKKQNIAFKSIINLEFVIEFDNKYIISEFIEKLIENKKIYWNLSYVKL